MNSQIRQHQPLCQSLMRCLVIHPEGTECPGYQCTCTNTTPQPPAQPNLYTEEEVLKAIEKAYHEGINAGSIEYGGEYFDPKDYLPKR